MRQQNASRGYEIALEKIREVKEKQLKRLDLGQLGLTELPEELFELTWLEELVLGNSYYPTIEEQEAYLAYDKEVYKTIFPNGNYTDNVGNLPNNFDSFTIFPLISFFEKISRLKYLNISHCLNEKDLHTSIVQEFEILILDGGLTKIEPHFKITKVLSIQNQVKGIDYFLSNVLFSNLDFLNISNNNSISKSLNLVNKLPQNLKFLVSDNNQIENFLFKDSTLKNLQYVQASNNNISSIDLSVISSYCEDLKFLNLSTNKINQIDGSAYNLETLILDNNLINDISKVNELRNLKKLSLSNNAISKIPPQFNAPNLQELNLSQNKIKDISPLYELKNLKKLDLSSNQIKDESQIKELLSRNKLIDLNIEGNPLESIPIEITKAGKKTVESFETYFSELDSHGEEKKNILKIILVGNSSAGKTSLRNMLQKRAFDAQEVTTHGIAVERFQLPKSKTEQPLMIEIWDFGGQEYYHETHRMFFSHHAIYIVVWDAKTNKNMVDKTTLFFKENDKKIERETYIEHHAVDYWLKQVRYYTNDLDKRVPIFLVQNKIDRLSDTQTPDYQYCMNRISTTNIELLINHEVKYEFHLSLKEANSRNDKNEFYTDYRNFENYLEQIIEEKQRVVSEEKSLADIRSKLDSKKKVVITRKEFDKICHAISPTSSDYFLNSLKAHCEALHFPENADLKDFVFINTEKLNAKIYEILDYRVLDLGGFFDENQVKDSDEFSNFGKDEATRKARIIALMKEMKLVFYDSKKKKYVAPQYLPTENTSRSYGFIKKSCGSPKFILKFPSYLPKTISNQILSKYAEKTIDSAYFKHGLAFDNFGFINVIEIDYQNAEIWFYAAQEDKKVIQPKFDVENIRNVFEDLMGLFGVKFTETIQTEITTTQSFQYIEVSPNTPQILLSLDEKNFIDWRKLSERFIKGSTADLNLEDPILSPEIGQDKQKREMFRLFFEKREILNGLNKLEISMQPIKVFISYSHKDEAFKDELVEHLSGLKRNGVIHEWNDRAIVSGDNWDNEIKKKLAESQVILFLVSASFMNSDYIHNNEIKLALEKYQRNEIVIAPIKIRPCDFNSLPLKVFQAMTKNNEAVSLYQDRDSAWMEVIENLKRAIDKLQGKIS